MSHGVGSTPTERTEIKMAVKRGTDRGVCRECNTFKIDLYRGFCGNCRQLFGKAKSMGVMEEHKGSEIVAELMYEKPKRDPQASKEQDFKLEAWRWKRCLVTLLNVLAEHGFSESDIAERYHQFGKVNEPDHSISILRKVVKHDEHDYSK